MHAQSKGLTVMMEMLPCSVYEKGMMLATGFRTPVLPSGTRTGPRGGRLRVGRVVQVRKDPYAVYVGRRQRLEVGQLVQDRGPAPGHAKAARAR